MKTYKTTLDLVNLQKHFWDEDLAIDGDKITDSPEELSLSDLIINDSLLKNAKLDGEDKIESLKEAIIGGQSLPPVLIDIKGEVIDGYHRIAACQELGIKSVPTIRLNRRSENI